MNRLRPIFFLVLALFAEPVLAHIGSPNIFFEGEAGPYPIRVMIRPPRVVPGLAEISVRIKTNSVTQVSVLPARWNTGRKGSPPPDIAIPVKGESNLYTSQLWLMDSGAYSVFVNVEGASGPATAIVPINSLALTRLEMPAWMSMLFLVLGLVLFITLAALVGTAVREGSLPRGETITLVRRRWGTVACALAVVFSTALLVVGKNWWDHVDRDFRFNRLYKPVIVRVNVQNGKIVVFPPDKGMGRGDRTPLVPDHGKMMHLFLIQQKTGAAFTHLHPTWNDFTKAFEAPLPPFPVGAYDLYADVTHESGLTETWISDLHLAPVHVTSTANPPSLDPDDAYLIGETNSSSAVKITWESERNLTANTETTLRFSVRHPDDTRVELQPYLGMYAHGVIWKDDGQVFTHLHPFGTISMTSQLLFAKREQGERDLASKPLDIVCGAPPKEVSFPYAFPEAGRYKIWVQVRTAGQIHTAPFDITIP